MNYATGYLKGEKYICQTTFFDYGSGGYYMGDPNYKNDIPRIKDVIEYKYIDEDGSQGGWKFTSEEAYERFGIRLIHWECALPISNDF